MWPVYHGLMRADFTLFDEYEHKHAGMQCAYQPKAMTAIERKRSSYIESSTAAVVDSCKLCEQVRVAGIQRFDFPIVAYWGTKDRKIMQAMVRGWRNFTTASFQLIQIDGHHLWPLVKEAKLQWLTSIVDHIEM